MRVVVTGATGNVGSALVDALLNEDAVEEIVGVARRRPDRSHPKVRWVAADVGADDLEPVFRGAAAVVHLAWLIQPSRRPEVLRRANVTGTERVGRAAAAAGVPALIHASSIGAYSPRPGVQTDERWPTGGIASSQYSREKAETERILDRLEAERPEMRIVRMRPALTGTGYAGAELRRLFLGRLFPRGLASARRIPVVPELGIRVQLVHTRDVADAYRRVLLSDLAGPLNVTADPPVDARLVARVLDARVVPLPARAARVLVDASWRAHLQPTPVGWFDMARSVPLLDATRARRELGWEPAHRPEDVLREVLAGVREGRHRPTPPLRGAVGDEALAQAAAAREERR
ncbi:MAG TPA: NAD-dependent epimerase/dehydratase family protein [Miltoncostaeaceae bacterium]|nr:NAD-dependent epimerase/dehydratase family protein [Miltoncostaeaceae bacterium]